MHLIFERINTFIVLYNFFIRIFDKIKKMSESKPIPPNKRRQAHLLRTQNKFWDVINSIELPIIIFMQKHFKAYTTTSFWNLVARLASASNVRLFPMILYSLGFEEKSKHLALSLVYFALFSSFGKYLIIRRRPGSYKGVHSPACASTSSFPSRHTISITIVAFFLPFQIVWISLIIMSRIMLGMHFLTDCILGVLVGKLALYLARFNTDPNFCLFILLVTFRVWSGAYKILSGSLPLLILTSLSSFSYCSKFVYSPCCILLVLIWKLLRKFLPKAKMKVPDVKKSTKNGESETVSYIKKNMSAYEMLVIELIPISFVVFLISETNKVLFCIRQIDFADNVNRMETECILCSSYFMSFLFTHMMKFDSFKKILCGIQTVDLFAINLKDKIINYF